MPAFYNRSMAGSQAPITPPDSGSGYSYGNMHYPRDPYVPHANLSQGHHESAYDYPQGYMHPAVAPAPPTYSYHQPAYQPTTTLPSISSYYEPMGAPVLPPLRIQDRLSFGDDYQRRLQQEQDDRVAQQQPRQVAKEEKPTGGVSAKLDYEMDRMTDFVTEATQSIFQQTMHSPTSFRKWVHQVLSATRLPSATILLSLHYLSDRLKVFPSTVTPGENQVYRLLAVALILGSKFLDDNTFINRSWSDVTAIKVSELNMLEMKWLDLIGYQLHVDPNTPHGLQAWLDTWKSYDNEKAAKQQYMSTARLSPLDTSIGRQPSRNDRWSPYPSPYSSARSQDTPLSSRPPGYINTSYANVGPWYQGERQQRYPTLSEIDEANRRVAEERAHHSAYYAQSAVPQSYYQPAPYTPSWDSAWNGTHRYDCGCSACVYQQHYRPYPMAPSYSAQTVMG
ncbi:hypothetical protein MBLNU230_g3336t1 [Neophaeotheca triangularis]